MREQRKEEAKQREKAGITGASAASAASARSSGQLFSSDDDDDDDDDDKDLIDLTKDGGGKADPDDSLPALPRSKWNLHRCNITNELDPPADEDEKKCWAHETNLLPEDQFPSDLEDPKGLYKLFGCNIRSSSDDIKAAFDSKKKDYYALARTHHPDKAGGDKEMINIYHAAKAEYEKVEEAYHVLHDEDNDGNCRERFEYDKSGQDLRRKFLEEFKKRHPTLSFAQRAAQIADIQKQKEISAKGHRTKAARKEADLVSQITLKYNCNGHQTNEVRLLIVKALQEGNTPTTLARSIRQDAAGYSKIAWDGKANNCKIIKRVKSVIGRIMADQKSGKLTDLLEGNADLKSKTVQSNTRGRKVIDTQEQLEKQLFAWCKDTWDNSKPITRYIVFHKVIEIDASFLGGVNSPDFFARMKNWFYYGFKRRYDLSRRKISSIGQKLPDDWQIKREDIVLRVARCQTPRKRGDGSFAPYVKDDDTGNTDQVPIYIEAHGNWQWGLKSCKDRRMIRTAGKEKDRITVQLTIFKSGRKGRIMIIFKAAAPPKDRPPRRNTVAHEIQHRLPDTEGNHYPPENECFLHCTPTANSNGEATLLYYNEVFLREVDAEEDGTLKRPACLLLDDFRGHSDKRVKEVTKNVVDLHWEIMAGGITPKAQPLDVLVNKVFKGHFRDLFQQWSLTAPTNEKGHPKAPSRQLLATWAVEAWNMVPEELVRKSWTVCQYKSTEEIANENASSSAIVEYDEEKLRQIVEHAAGIDALTLYDDPENAAEDEFPEDEDEDDIE